ncbi:hypothetical protein D9M68_68920 [compost metagenome]
MVRRKGYCHLGRAIALAEHDRSRIQTFVVALACAEAKDMAARFDTAQLYEMTAIPNLAYLSSHQPDAHESLQYFFYDASIGNCVLRSDSGLGGGCPDKNGHRWRVDC